MIIVEEVQPAGLGAVMQDWEIDTLTLPWEERCRSHGRRKTDRGREFALACLLYTSPSPRDNR